MAVYPGWLIMNLYTLALAGLLLIFAHGNRNREGSAPFTRLILITIILLIVDTAGKSVEGIYAPKAGGVHQVCTYVAFAFDPFMYLFAINYIDSYVFRKEKVHRRRFLYPMQIYVVLNALLVTVSAVLNLGWFYRFTDGVYSRGVLFIPRAIINFFFCIWVQIYVVQNRGHINRTYRLPLSLFPGIMLLGGFLQVLFSGLSIEYPATIIACLILFTYVQRVDLNEDPLTKTMNRRGLDRTLERLSLPGQKPFGSVMVDLDFFKEINDRYGHNVGDEALVIIAEALQHSFPQRAAVGRHGGDEFMVFLPDTTAQELETCIQTFRKRVEKLNQSGRQPYQLHVSVGYAVYDPVARVDIKTFQNQVDEMMYAEKAENHRRAGYFRGGTVSAAETASET